MRTSLATIAVALLGSQVALAQREHTIPLFVADGHPVREGFARIINHSMEAGTVSIVAIDDSGNRSEPITLTLGARAAAQFNSGDLESGNSSKGLSGQAGDGDGDWRLELATELDIEPLAYVRTEGGFLTSMHDIGPTGHYLPIFNPGSNRNQQSRIRVINPNAAEIEVTIFGRDDDGSLIAEDESFRAVSFRLPAGAARTIGADVLEAGDEDLEGALGDGAGKWRLEISADGPIFAMSLLESANGKLTNLSRTFQGGFEPPANSYKINGEDAYNSAGRGITSAGDVDGDGLADLVIGQWSIGYPEPVYLVAAASLATLDGADDKADGVIDLGHAGDWDGSWKLLAEKVVYGLYGDYSPTAAGFSVATAGDVDGDGLSDFLVGTNNGGRPLDDVEEWVKRAAFLISGGDLAELSDEYGSERNEINLDAYRFQALSSWQFVGEGEDAAGISVAPAGDVDGDGLADLYIGADEAGDENRGAVYLVSAADLPALDRADGFADGYILLGEIVRD